MDPRDALLNIDFDDFGFGGKKKRSARSVDGRLLMDEDDEKELLAQLQRLRTVVEDEHDQRFRGIEIHIKWLMALVLGEVLAIVGYAITSVGGS